MDQWEWAKLSTVHPMIPAPVIGGRKQADNRAATSKKAAAATNALPYILLVPLLSARLSFPPGTQQPHDSASFVTVGCKPTSLSTVEVTYGVLTTLLS
jgi:hypothetical protein